VRVLTDTSPPHRGQVYMKKHEQHVKFSQENAVLSYIRSPQKPPTTKTRNQIFVIRCHKYGCFDNAG